MKCPVCGAAELIRDTRDLPYTYKGETTTIAAVTGDFCPACGEIIFDPEQGDRYSEWMGTFQRQVNAAFVEPNLHHPRTQEARPRPARGGRNLRRRCERVLALRKRQDPTAAVTRQAVQAVGPAPGTARRDPDDLTEPGPYCRRHRQRLTSTVSSIASSANAASRPAALAR